MKLRPYQIKIVEDIKKSLATGHKRPCVVSGTGTGKTVIFSHIVSEALKKNNSSMTLVHRDEILEQTIKKYFEFSVQSGQVRSGKLRTKDKAQIAMINTLVNQLNKIDKPKFLIVDECAHAVSPTWSKVINHFDVPTIGFTATPERADGTGLIEIFDDLILAPQVDWFVDEGYLSYPYLKTSEKAVKDKFHMTRGDFDKKEQEDVMSKKYIIGDVITHYKQYLDGMPTIVSCVSIKHAYIMAEQYNTYAKQTGKDWKAVVVQGGSKFKKERNDGIKGLETGSVQLVCFVDVISEGLDVPFIVGVQNLRRTASLAFILQVWGRALRPVYANGYDLDTKYGRLEAMANGIKPHAIILDHASNWDIHGHPLDRREWSLNAIKRSKRKKVELKTTSCPKCGSVWPGSPLRCPGIYPNGDKCGFVFSVNPDVAGQQRKTPKQIEGELIAALPNNIDKTDLNELTNFVNRLHGMDGKKRQKALLAKSYELSKCNNYDEFKKLMKPLSEAVGYKAGWSNYVWKNILKK